jgi:Flp pilus assembly pilin Flp
MKSDAESHAKTLREALWRDESGQDIVEYTLLVALLGIGVVLSWYYILSSSISTVLLSIAKQLLMLLS